LSLSLHKVKGHSGIIENDLADEFAKKGLSRINVLNIPETSYKDLKYIPKWKDQSIDNSLRSFVNITTAIAYETEWSNLHNMVEVTNRSQDNNSHNKLIWSNIWQILKKLQGRKCTSLKKSKALIFRIKCINDILPTKDICYQRNPKLYKSKKCVACFCADETLYHIAECEVYQKIWKNLEEEAIQLTRLEALSKLDIILNENIFREAILGKEQETRKLNRKMFMRGLSNNKQQNEIYSLIGSKKKASKVLICFMEHFWNCFHERLWKFRCEVVIDWEKENNISIKEKRLKKKRRKKEKASADKENSNSTDIAKETKKEKETRIQKEASNKVDNWVKFGVKEEWLCFKNK
jgi:hypothetical protein